MNLIAPEIFSRGLRLALMLFAASPLVRAAPPTAEADAVLDRWVEASGGAKRLKAIKQSDYRLRMTFGTGAVILAEATSQAGGAYRLVMQTPAGEVVTADDGRIGWVHHTSLGGRVLEPAKAERGRRTAGPGEMLRVKSDYPQRRRLADGEIDGKKVSVVELVDARGWRERWHFSAATGLRVRREQPDDENDSVSDYADFRKVNGVVEPFQCRMHKRRGGDSLLEILSAAHVTKATGERWSPPEGLEADSRRIDDALRKFQDAMGSKEAFAKIKSRVTKARLEVPASGMSIMMQMSVRVPDRVLLEQTVPGMGRTLQGFDGKTGWAWSEMQGYRELRGAELMQLMAMASLTPRVAGDEAPLRRIVGESTDAHGHRVLAVDLASVAGSTGICHFDLETGLLAKVETVVQAGPGSSLKVVMELSDYRTVDGVKIAFVQAMANPAMRVVTHLTEVEHNRELPDEIFRPRKDGEIPRPPAAAAPAGKETAPVPAPAAPRT